jgi:ribose/xylose/arabinose/galactoside ABC-type transport system permease subunit
MTIPPKRRETLGRTAEWLNKFGPLVGLVFVIIVFGMLRPRTFLTWDNFEVMLLQTAVVGTAALGMTLIIISGGIDLSVGSTIALCTVAVALLLSAGMPPLIAALGGILTGAACGALIGGIVTRLRLTPFIVTLGMWGALRGAAKGLAGEQMVFAPETWLNNLLTTLGEQSGWMILPPGVWLTVILALLTAGVLRYTRFGRHIYAIGSNELTARLCGVRVEQTKVLIYMLGAAFAGVAGVLQFSYLTMGDPTTAIGMELDVIAAVVIGGGSLAGGEGSVPGSIIGALIMTVVANGCTKLGLANWIQEIVTGLIIVLAVALDQLRHRKTE